ncbi:hypothetical protein OXX80_013881 [Metschnikowia pulcherrima]
MMSLDATSSKETYTNENTLTYLAGLDLRLAGHVNEDVAIDYASILSELDAILKQMLHLEKEKTAKKYQAEGYVCRNERGVSERGYGLTQCCENALQEP